MAASESAGARVPFGLIRFDVTDTWSLGELVRWQTDLEASLDALHTVADDPHTLDVSVRLIAENEELRDL